MAVPVDISEPTFAGTAPDQTIEIGSFTLYPERHLLHRNGEAVRIGSRALSLLIALAERRGELVSKEALIARVWPETFVEEANLRVHIAALRKVLGDTADPPQYISNVSGRGYKLVAAPAFTADPSAPTEGRSSPAALTRLIGRDSEVATLVDRVAKRRLITISGPGGIGKTSVAFAVLQGVQELFEDGIVTVDLGAAAADAGSLPQAIAIALKVSISSSDAMPGLTSYLKDKNLLLLLDNCEHIIDAVTKIAELLLRVAPSLHILATSTEPMRAEGEWIFRLLPLEVPSEAENLLAEEALGIPAIELFVERAAASSEAFQFTDADVPLVSEICRRLDGNPLAIEIAAASVEAFGLGDLASHLDDRFEVLVQGRRTAAPRHQTLRNLLDWSHGTLSQSERATLRRLSVFRGVFALEAARVVAALDNSALAVINDIASLVRKSLLSVNVSGNSATYRLLDSTRAYARERAAEANELQELSRQHASYFEGLLERAEVDWTRMLQTDWVVAYGYVLDDARAATDWALSPEGDVAQGLRLTTLLLPLGFQFALVEEMGSRIELALSRAAEASPRQLVAEIRLNVARSSLGQNRNLEFASEDPTLSRAMELAIATGDPAQLVAPLIKYATHALTMGRYDIGLGYAERASNALVNSNDDLAKLGADRVLAQATNMYGDHARAVVVATRVIAHPAKNIPLTFGSLQIDRQVSMRVVLARSLWMQGFAHQAKSVMLEALVYARKDGPYAICLAFGFGACPVAMWSGFDDEAQAMTSEMLEKAERYTLHTWHRWAEIFDMVLARRRGDPPRRAVPGVSLQADTLVTLDERMVDDEAMRRARAGLAGWANPEMLRATAVRMLKSTRSERNDEAIELLNASMEQARLQTALAWELRTATTLAELHVSLGQPGAMRAVLEPVYERLSEGFDTADALRALDLLNGRVS